MSTSTVSSALHLDSTIASLETPHLRLAAGPAIEDPSAHAQLRGLQAQVDALNDEIAALRRRDETVKFCMHRLDEEMRLAARLQQDFLPKSLPQLGSVRFHTLFRPAGYVSGDLYDVMRLDERHVGFYMADAVGHGMPAALLTMFIKNALVTKEIYKDAYRLLEPGETLARLNEALIGQNLSHATFATALYGMINTQTLELTFARGGHPSPVVLRSNGETQIPAVEGSLLGIFPGELFDTAKLQLQPGDRVMIYSDGIEVAFSGDQTIDTDRWKGELEKRRALSSAELIAALADQIDRESGSLAPKDDLTIILLEIAALEQGLSTSSM